MLLVEKCGVWAERWVGSALVGRGFMTRGKVVAGRDIG